MAKKKGIAQRIKMNKFPHPHFDNKEAVSYWKKYKKTKNPIKQKKNIAQKIAKKTLRKKKMWKIKKNGEKIKMRGKKKEKL